MYKRFSFVALLFIFTFGNLGLGSFANANQNQEFSKAEISELEDVLEEIGVYKKDIPLLIKKLREGKVWDSFNPEKMTEEVQKRLTPSFEEAYKMHRFEDGSIIVNSIEAPKETEFGIMSTIQCGTGYCNYIGYKVSHNTGLINAHFYADFSITNGKTVPDSISRAYDHKATAFFGSTSEINMSIVRATESVASGLKAEAILSFVATTVGGWAGGNCWLRLSVGQDTYTVDHSY